MPQVNPKLSVKFNQKGNLSVAYYSPDDPSPLKTRDDILVKLASLYDGLDFVHGMKRFTLQKIYCVCHQEADRRIYVSCKYGKAGI